MSDIDSTLRVSASSALPPATNSQPENQSEPTDSNVLESTETENDSPLPQLKDRILDKITGTNFKWVAERLSDADLAAEEARQIVIEAFDTNPDGVVAAFSDGAMSVSRTIQILCPDKEDSEQFNQIRAKILTEMLSQNPGKASKIFRRLRCLQKANTLLEIGQEKAIEILKSDGISARIVALSLTQLKLDEKMEAAENISKGVLHAIENTKKATKILRHIEAAKEKENLSELMAHHFHGQFPDYPSDDGKNKLVSLAEKNFPLLLSIFCGGEMNSKEAAQILVGDASAIPVASKILGEMAVTQQTKVAEILNWMAIYDERETIAGILQAIELDEATLVKIFMDDAMDPEEIAVILTGDASAIPVASKILGKMAVTQQTKVTEILNWMAIYNKWETIAGILQTIELDEATLVKIFMDDAIDPEEAVLILIENIPIASKVLGKMAVDRPEKAAEILNWMALLGWQIDAADILCEIEVDIAVTILSKSEMSNGQIFKIFTTLFNSKRTLRAGKFLEMLYLNDCKRTVDILNYFIKKKNMNVIDIFSEIKPEVLLEFLSDDRIATLNAAWILDAMCHLTQRSKVMDILEKICAINFNRGAKILAHMEDEETVVLIGQMDLEFAAKLLTNVKMSLPNAARILDAMCASGQQSKVANFLMEIYSVNLQKAAYILAIIDSERAAMAIGKMDLKVAVTLLANVKMGLLDAAKILGAMCNSGQQSKVANILVEIYSINPQKAAYILAIMDSERAAMAIEKMDLKVAAKLLANIEMGFTNAAEILDAMCNSGLQLKVANILMEIYSINPQKVAYILPSMDREHAAMAIGKMDLEFVATLLADVRVSDKEVVKILDAMCASGLQSKATKILEKIFSLNPQKVALVLRQMVEENRLAILASLDQSPCKTDIRQAMENQPKIEESIDISDKSQSIIATIKEKNLTAAAAILMDKSSEYSEKANILVEMQTKNFDELVELLLSDAMSSEDIAFILTEFKEDNYGIAANILEKMRQTDSPKVAEILAWMSSFGHSKFAAEILMKMQIKDSDGLIALLLSNEMNIEDIGSILIEFEENDDEESNSRIKGSGYGIAAEILEKMRQTDSPKVAEILAWMSTFRYSKFAAEILREMQIKDSDGLIALLLSNEMNIEEIANILLYFKEDHYGIAAGILEKMRQTNSAKVAEIFSWMSSFDCSEIAAGILEEMTTNATVDILSADEIEIEEMGNIISSMKDEKKLSAILLQMYIAEENQSKVVHALFFLKPKRLNTLLSGDSLSPYAENIKLQMKKLGDLPEDDVLDSLSENEVPDTKKSQINDDKVATGGKAEQKPILKWTPVILIGLGCGVLGALASFLAIFFIPTLVVMWSVVICANLACAIAASAGIAFYQSRIE
ncbi:MAG: hypothetical protein LBI69_03080 [Puniceicoccales bacterium]|jgi:DNA-binding transcriptional ArsR family regulator|nr:hypothetical protein [Puniceicoccales bacterium]